MIQLGHAVKEPNTGNIAVGVTAAIKHTDATKWPVSHRRGYSYGGVVAFIGKRLEAIGDKVKLTI